MAFNFEDNKKDAIVLLQTVAQELGTEDMNKAGRIFRAVLQSIRDRLPVIDAVQFAAQLPIFWKGIYFDQYDVSKVPVEIRDAQEWINYIRNKNAFAANNDFQQDEEISAAFRSVVHALQQHMTDGQLQQVINSLNQDIQELLVV
ncbi:DUF2267 domain-containing protein [Pontibacter roseus]|uniref:DUF2267 domain-containing protein n=1 Tax=Pontibacter roseus TaxID=336989 RepID=UPI000379CB1E|nr:DUF2267 domain-containing protein [Pontibacter roseus]